MRRPMRPNKPRRVISSVEELQERRYNTPEYTLNSTNITIYNGYFLKNIHANFEEHSIFAK